jgi:hypothetical protein
MTSRSTKRKRDAKYVERARHMRHVGRVIEKLEPDLRALKPPVVRTKYLGPFSGAPDDFDVSFVFSRRRDARNGVTSGALERASRLVLDGLGKDGYPREALRTFRFHAISEEEIKDAGGEWAFDRS